MKKLAAVLAGFVLACVPADSPQQSSSMQCLPDGWTFVSYYDDGGGMHTVSHVVMVQGAPTHPRVFRVDRVSGGKSTLVAEHGAGECK